MSLGGNAFSLCGKLVRTRFNVFSQILNYMGISKAKTNFKKCIRSMLTLWSQSECHTNFF